MSGIVDGFEKDERDRKAFFLNRCADVRTREVRVSLVTFVCIKVVPMGLNCKLEKMISERLIKRGENKRAKQLMLLGVIYDENETPIHLCPRPPPLFLLSEAHAAHRFHLCLLLCGRIVLFSFDLI